MTDERMWRYLLLDDHGARGKRFERQINHEHLDVKVMEEAIELRDVKDTLTVLDGLIVDFHLNTSAEDELLRYPCTEPDCPDLAVAGSSSPEDVAAARAEHAWHVDADIPSVEVTTGLGAMLYLKQHAPNVALYGFCEDEDGRPC